MPQRADEPLPPGAARIKDEISVDHSGVTNAANQLDGMPLWARVGATLSAISIVSGLLVYLVVNQVHNQNASAATFERLIDKFDIVIEKHDDRQREWMRSHSDRITTENEKTRAVLNAIGDRQNEASKENVRLHEAQLLVLKQIRDEKAKQ